MMFDDDDDDDTLFRNEFAYSSGDDSHMQEEEEDEGLHQDIAMLLYDVQPMPETKGGVILFGKVWNPSNACYESCAIRIPDVPYEFYGKVRGDNWMAATKDILSMLQSKCIPETSSTLKKCRRSFWFTQETRSEQGEIGTMTTGSHLPFIRVSYSSRYGTLESLPPASCSKGLEAIVGTTYTAQERFLLQKQIQGIRWIKAPGCIPIPEGSVLQPRHTYCVQEWQCSSFDAVTTIESQGEVPLRACCIRTCTVLRSGTEELASVYIDTRQVSSEGELHEENYDDDDDDNLDCMWESDASKHSSSSSSHLYLTRALQGVGAMREETETTLVHFNERQLLTAVFDSILALDPDIIIGHKLSKDIQFILSRVIRLSTCSSSWQYLGRLRERARTPELYHVFTGRFFCDVWSFFQGPNINTSGKESYLTYDLRELEKRRLSGGKLLQDGCGLQRRDLRDTIHQNVRYFVVPALSDKLELTLATTSRVCYQLIANANCIPLAFNLALVTGCPLSVAFGSNRYQPNEWFLMHVMTEYRWLIPDRKVVGRSTSSRSCQKRSHSTMEAEEPPAVTFQGGKVVDPQYGVQTIPIHLLDFTSMYPSIVMNYSLCFSDNADDKLLPEIMRQLMKKRAKAKQAVVRPGDKNDILQFVLKLVANTKYGCLAFPPFRFYCRDLAAKIPELGRQVLTTCIRIAGECGYKVVYGDTDSVGLVATSESVPIDEFMRRVTEETKINLKLENTFERSFFATKKTLSYLPQESVTIDNEGKRVVDMRKRVDKGLATIIRTVPYVTKAHAHAFLKAIMTAEVSMLRDTRSLALFVCERIKIEEEKVLRSRPLEHFVMHVQLKKRIHNYQTSRTPPPHVRVAQWLKDRGYSAPALKGESIPLVWCEGGEVCHPDQLREHPYRYRIDFAWYMKSSVMKTLFAFCRAIDEKLPSEITGFLAASMKDV